MKRYLTALAVAVTCVATTATSQTELDRFDISINAEDETAQSTLMTLATTFAMMAPRTSGQRKASRLEFRSGNGLVEDGAASEKLRTALPGPLANSIAQVASVASPCDVSRHRFDDTDVLMVIHDSGVGQPQDTLRCFIAGLWVYHAGSTESISVDDWRAPYARILASLAGGRPAFSGFVVEEN
ncbi:hypothetical protein [uncultured Tateyamaria sp.]|uniref:hypothetical protein n=1 Tax=uncultured Tateyamaria sp. TaxID=455651 RepID=UPI0026093C3D|nr:hypothetical protein [uncultured Tateyamaria sp.]